MSIKLWQLPYPAVSSDHPLRKVLACHGAVTSQRWREISWTLAVGMSWRNKLESERHPNTKTNESDKQALPRPLCLTSKFCLKSSSRGGAGKTRELIWANTFLWYLGSGALTQLTPKVKQKCKKNFSPNFSLFNIDEIWVGYDEGSWKLG